MKKQKIFFSYSRADGSTYALKLAEDLKKKGYDVWIDQEDIRAGLEWDVEIEKALKTCDCLLFLETEKSVVSNNVLDEVYYALEQNKKVIPLIYVDSKTPFRLHRLQHINFTGNYETGFTALLQELEGNTAQTSHSDETPAQSKRGYFNKPTVLIAIAIVALLIAVIAIFSTKNKNLVSAETSNELVKQDAIVNDNDSLTNVVSTEVVTADEKELERPRKINSPSENNKHGRQRKMPANRTGGNDDLIRTPVLKRENSKYFATVSSDSISGDWTLIDMEPKVKSMRGYIKIEALDANRASVKSYLQFYYPESNDSSYLTIFNAFAGCSSCNVKQEMKLNAEDISVGSKTVKKLQEDHPDGRKAGEIFLDANSNKSVRGTITLQFLDNNNAVIKVKQPLTITLANDLLLQPFEYTFRFKKNE